MTKFFLLITVLFLMLSGCSATTVTKDEAFRPESWNDVEQAGKGKTVTILMWGGNEQVNRYMDEWVAPALQEQYEIILRRVPMAAPEFMAKLVNEKRSDLKTGTADLLWINAENFRTAKEGGLLWGPFTHLLPNQQQYYDEDSQDLHYDTGVAIEGYEALWGRAQLVMAYDEARMAEPPHSYSELLTWARENPGQFTYPNPVDDFVGAAFIRSAYYELTGLDVTTFSNKMDREEFRRLSQPMIDYFLELQPYLWRQGKAYPATQAQLDDFFRNGETALSMGFEVGKTLGLVREGIYPDTVRSLIFSTGSVGNSHYLAIPFNAPEKAAALLVINFLQSPEAQLEKYRPETWGDMPGIDPSRLTSEQQNLLSEIENDPAMPDLTMLADRRLPEMRAEMIDWIKEIWLEEIGGK